MPVSQSPKWLTDYKNPNAMFYEKPMVSYKVMNHNCVPLRHEVHLALGFLCFLAAA